MSAGRFYGLVWRILLTNLAMGLVAAQGQTTTNGIFADFTTSMGNFTCQLEYAKTPKTVASFIGLVTGQRPWLDLNTGLVRHDPFYTGITFHRVIAGFMIQGGSPNGQGTDGPGYTFIDELTASLNFNAPWMLAMANSGPDSNGSQFFVTVGPYTTGNNKYTVFGHVTAGTNVISVINHVATDSSNNKPLTNVVIQSVAIRRVGSTAQAFNINSHSLPVVTNLPLQINLSTQQVSLTFSNQAYTDNRLFFGTNLVNWSSQPLGIETGGPLTNTVSQSNNAPAEFFRMAQVQYASSTFAPKTVSGRTLSLVFANGGGTLILKPDANGGGTYSFSGNPPGSGAISQYTYLQQPYRGLLYPIYYSGNLAPMTLQLVYQTASSGTFNGTAYSTSQISITGSFTSSGP